MTGLVNLLPTIRLSDVKARPIQWLWPGLIARGKVSIIAGHPGLGKSQITASLAGIVTMGKRWPVSGERTPAGRVIFLCGEDDIADTIRPRCEAASADLSRIEVVQPFQEPEGIRYFSLKADTERLAEKLDESGDVALVVIDPISAYLAGTDTHRNADVRSVLHPLGDVAARYGAAIVAVDHLSKNQNNSALMRVNGSVGFTGMARSVLLVTTDKNDPERRLLVTAKNNLAPDQLSLGFRVIGVTVSDGIKTSVIAWESESADITADEAMTTEEGGKDSAVDDAVGFLRTTLAGGPMRSSKLQREARDAGHAWRTVQRAGKDLADCYRDRDSWYWLLK